MFYFANNHNVYTHLSKDVVKVIHNFHLLLRASFFSPQSRLKLNECKAAEQKKRIIFVLSSFFSSLVEHKNEIFIRKHLNSTPTMISLATVFFILLHVLVRVELCGIFKIRFLWNNYIFNRCPNFLKFSIFFFAGFSQLKTSFNSGNGMSGESLKSIEKKMNEIESQPGTIMISFPS